MSVLIISNHDDFSIDPVIKWLTFFREDNLVINFNSLGGQTHLNWSISNEVDTFPFSNEKFKSNFKSAWFRSDTTKSNTASWSEKGYTKELKSLLLWEMETLKVSILASDGNTRWLSDYKSTQLDKLKVLRIAKNAKINIPETLVTTNKESLKSFLSKHGSVICKAAYENISHIKTTEGYLKQFVEEIDDQTVEALPDYFFPSFFQRKIPKEFDVRVFYLNGKCFSMAIFSKAVDYRADYSIHRNIPLKLPTLIEEQICSLMKYLELNTGSLDFVKNSEDGKFYFLEINPNGQFGMVSEPCNYYLEREIAKFLCHVE